MKQNIKSIVIFIILTTLLGSTSSCSLFKHPDIKNVESLINEIGTVTLASSAAIDTAMDAYNLLDEKKKEQVENFDVLDKANKDFLFLYAKSVFAENNDAVEKTEEIVDLFQKAWHFCLYEDQDTRTIEVMALELDISATELNNAKKAYGSEANFFNRKLKEGDFNPGLKIVSAVIGQRGDYELIENLLESVKTKLRDIEDKYPNYENHKALLDYYSKANSYYDYFANSSYTYNSFIEDTNRYKISLKDLKSPLDYIYGD